MASIKPAYITISPDNTFPNQLETIYYITAMTLIQNNKILIMEPFNTGHVAFIDRPANSINIVKLRWPG